MEKSKASLETIKLKVVGVLKPVMAYRVLIAIIFVALVYGYVYSRMNSLNNAQPSASAVSSQTNPVATAHIDKKVVNQLESLRDNSVNVQALFEQARNNPFQD